jgi:hypothetical protein
MKAEQGTGVSNFNAERDSMANAESNAGISAASSGFRGSYEATGSCSAGAEQNASVSSGFNAKRNDKINPNFKKEFGDYLEANGYVLSNKPTHPGAALYFFGHGQGVMITGDSIDFASFAEQGSERSALCSTYATFTGISQLDTYGWMMLMHITGIVPLNQFMLGGSNRSTRTRPGWPTAAVC